MPLVWQVAQADAACGAVRRWTAWVALSVWQPPQVHVGVALASAVTSAALQRDRHHEDQQQR